MEKHLSDMILKILIDERYLATLSYDRIKALAQKIAEQIHATVKQEEKI